MHITNKVKIKSYHEKRLVAGSPWIFSNEIDNFSALKNLPAGTLVRVEIHQNPEFALAYFNPHSLISCRLLSYNVDEVIDQNFFAKKISQALFLRQKFFQNNFYRLVNSESDGLGGLIIDRYDNIFICQISTAGMEKLKNFIVEALTLNFPHSVILFKNNSELRIHEKLSCDSVIENPSNQTFNNIASVIENDLDFKVDLVNGQKTGWFFDQNINRQFAEKIAKNADVLDGYCYVGGFGSHAIKGLAKSVTFVDSSNNALELCKINANNAAQKYHRNCQLNFYQEKIFDLFENQNLVPQSFDLIMLDPPAFVKNKKDFFSGFKGYEKLIKLACPFLRKNSYLMLSSCSHHLSLEDLIQAAQNGFNKSKKHAKLIRCFGAGIDHPIHPSLKENEYLKSITFFIE